MKLEIFWRQLVDTGAEHLVLSIDGSVHADSLAVGRVDGTSYRIRYEIDCDARWSVQSFSVSELFTGEAVQLARGSDNRWRDGQGHPVDGLDGCTDVDIMITPFTNTLPIRRLNLAAGEAREISVVYVGLPGLVVSRFEQRYTCLSVENEGGLYRYQSLRSGFSADLRVDSDALVVNYPNIFRMDAKRRLADG